jgi:hypothetical protein
MLYSGILNVRLCPNLLLIMHCKLPSSAKYKQMWIEHSRFDQEKDTSAIIRNMRFYVRLEFCFVFRVHA